MIKGNSEMSLAGILGEAENISGFLHVNSLLLYARLYLAKANWGSGKGKLPFPSVADQG